MPKKGKEIRFFVEDDLYNELQAIMKLRDEDKMTELCRKLLRDAAAREIAEEGIDAVSSILRKLIKEEFKVTENRIAKITAKTAIAASTGMYMSYQVLKDLGARDVHAVYDEARKKGVAFVQSPLDELMVDKK